MPLKAKTEKIGCPEIDDYVLQIPNSAEQKVGRFIKMSASFKNNESSHSEFIHCASP